jgi:hypothetical protein
MNNTAIQAHQTESDPSDLITQIRNSFNGDKIKNILLVTPPDADSDLFRYETAIRGRYTNYPPYGLGVIAKNLEIISINV